MVPPQPEVTGLDIGMDVPLVVFGARCTLFDSSGGRGKCWCNKPSPKVVVLCTEE